MCANAECAVCHSATRGIKGHAILCVVLGLLASEVSAQAESSAVEEVSFLKARLHSLKDRYRHLCVQYTSLAQNCSAPGNCSEDDLVIVSSSAASINV